MPSVKNHHELIYVMRMELHKMIWKQYNESMELMHLTTNEIIAIEDQINVSYDSGKLYIAFNHFKANLDDSLWSGIADQMEEEVFPEVLENEFSIEMPEKWIYHSNEYIEYEIPLPKHVTRYLVTGVW